jgi:hypothetical protein
MSTIVSKNVQIGADGTASNNFTAYQPATPDGTLRIGNGNSGSVTDAITLTSAGLVGIGTSSPASYVGKVVVNGHQSIIGGNALFLWDSGNANAPSIYAPSDSIAFRNNAGTEGMRLTSTGLGIGTSSPATALDVNGTITAVGAITNNSGITFQSSSVTKAALNVAASTNQGVIGTVAGDTYQWTTGGKILWSTNSGSTANLVLDSSGNLGLGVTPSAWGSGRTALQIGGSGYVIGVGQIDVGVNYYYNGAYRYVGTGYASSYQSYNGLHAWYNAPSGTAGNAISFTQAMTLDASGNLLVGTTSSIDGARITSVAAGSVSLGLNGSGGAGMIVRHPAANQIDFTTVATSSFFTFSSNTTERVRIDSSGNVGIGVSSPSAKLHVAGSGNLAINSRGNLLVSDGGTATQTAGEGGQISFGAWLNGDLSEPYPMGVIRGVSESSTTNDNRGALVFGTAATSATVSERMRIDSAGNVGVGITNPGSYAKLAVNGSVGIAGGNPAYFYNSANSNYASIASVDTNGLAFATGATERVRIASNGDLYIARTSTFSYANGKVCIQADGVGNPGLVVGVGVTTSYNNIILGNGNGNVGSIVTNGSSTSFNTSSDYRLKEDWVAVANASTRVNALKPVNFAWKVDGSRVDGFLAHELSEVVPEAVTGTKDAVDAEGKPIYQGIDQSKLVPLLTAALQEALAKIESLEARLDAANI